MNKTTLNKVFWFWWLPVALVALWWFGTASSTNFFFPPLSRAVDVTLRDLGNGIPVDLSKVWTPQCRRAPQG